MKAPLQRTSCGGGGYTLDYPTFQQLGISSQRRHWPEIHGLSKSIDSCNDKGADGIFNCASVSLVFFHSGDARKTASERELTCSREFSYLSRQLSAESKGEPFDRPDSA